MTFNELVIEAGITPDELSALTDISEVRINDLMSGKANILSLELDELFPIARAIDTTASALVNKLCDC